MANETQGNIQRDQNQDRKSGFSALNDAERGGQSGNNAQSSQQGKDTQGGSNDSRRMVANNPREDRSGN